jgi:hypothetical protein
MAGLSGEKIDVVIPYSPKEKDIVEMCILGCMKNISDLGQIYVISADESFNYRGVNVIGEKVLFTDGLNRQYVEQRLNKEHPKLAFRAGWFYQQFIKLGCSYAIPRLSESYVVVDADVVFLKKVNFFDNGKLLLASSNEYNEPYFRCYEKLLGQTPDKKHSFVSHHMPFSKAIVLGLISIIERRFNRKWYDAVLDSVDGDYSMFSEYETFGHFAQSYHPEKCRIRRLRNLQRFKVRSLLKLIFYCPDYVTIHNYKKPWNNPRTNPFLYKCFLDLTARRLKNGG